MNDQYFSSHIPSAWVLTRVYARALSSQPVIFRVIGWQVGETLELSIYEAAEPATSTNRAACGDWCASIVHSPPSAALTSLHEYTATVRQFLKSQGVQAPRVESHLFIHPGVVPF